MRKKKFTAKLLAAIVAAALSFAMLAGCGKETYRLKYYDETDPERGYNENLFYLNDMPAECADPTCIYIDDESDPDYGWFYMYPTSSLYGGHGNVCYRSRDMKTWEYVCPIFEPAEDSWLGERLWAPEVIYDKTTKKYYLFGSAANNTDTYNRYRVVFYTHADRAEWNRVAASVEAIVEGKTKAESLPILLDLVEREKAFLETVEPGVEQANGKTYDATRVREALDYVAKVYSFKLLWANADREALLDTPSAVSTNYKELLFTAIYVSAAYLKVMPQNFSYALYVAVADSPRGPFVQYVNEPGTDGYDETKRTLTAGDPFVGAEDIYEYLLNRKSAYWKDVTKGTDRQAEEAKAAKGQITLSESEALTLIDVHPYLDPVTGKKYLYAAVYADNGNYIIGTEAGENWTDEPKWETLTRLTRVGYYTTDDMSTDNKTDLVEGGVNEGPFLYYRNGTYYLTMSVNSYTSKNYAVIQAVADNPMGPFRKLSTDEGGKIIGSEPQWDHIGGPGHHSLCEYDGNLYIIYHSHYNRLAGTGVRGSCFDPIVWTKNADGQEIMHCNGPTYSLQPKAGPDAQYKNVAGEATITTNEKNADPAALNDGIIRFFSWDNFIKEFECGKKKTTITLSFDDYRTIRAIMIYNSYDYQKHFENIDKIEFDAIKTIDGKEKKITALIENLKFDVDRYINAEEEGAEFMRPGGAAIAEFAELKVKEIRITLKHDAPVAISEIFVLGL